MKRVRGCVLVDLASVCTSLSSSGALIAFLERLRMSPGEEGMRVEESNARLFKLKASITGWSEFFPLPVYCFGIPGGGGVCGLDRRDHGDVMSDDNEQVGKE